eukprot:CAMPEP_0118919666 /NCGR_PEP_ID=MMETSP1166-20130328/18671_1 /TAXON_ID=1104430 /ORGANISM="Chrysoreinhardia sp, Strain CCMP3193" /LENGTH=394 /DNA_ID=CAMNT_0006860195 /DNA_START=27 /DNA_END=1208 /DNA_ORIENTATION=+
MFLGTCFGYGGGEPSTEETGTARRRRRPVAAIAEPVPGEGVPSTSPFNASEASGSPSDCSTDCSTVASPSAAPSVESPIDSATSAAPKFFEAPVPVHESVEDAEERKKREKFLRDYQGAAKKFDEDSNDDVVFFQGIEDPDAFTEIAPRGVVLVLNADGQTWDAYIRKVPNEGHQAATTRFGAQLTNYADVMNSKFTPKLWAGGGHREVDPMDLDNDEVLPKKRTDPDVVLRVAVGDDTEPHVVIEVELSNRDPLKLAQHVHQLMTSWQDLRCVIGIKIYKRSGPGGVFSVVVIVWKKRGDGSVFVERVFDIGPRPSKMTSKEAVADFWSANNVDFTVADDGFEVTELPHELPYPLPDECPSYLKQHFTVTVPQEDVYHGHVRRAKAKKQKTAP